MRFHFSSFLDRPSSSGGEHTEWSTRKKERKKERERERESEKERERERELGLTPYLDRVSERPALLLVLVHVTKNVHCVYELPR